MMGVRGVRLREEERDLVRAMAVETDLVVENAKSQRAPEVLDWVEENSAEIELHFLPTCSPELNAAESV